MTPAEALELRFEEPDTRDEMTIREYFRLLLTTLWEEGEGFSGKRPLGNSGWEYNLQQVLVENGCVAGEIERFEEDDEVYVEVNDVDDAAYMAFIYKMIAAL